VDFIVDMSIEVICTEAKNITRKQNDIGIPTSTRNHKGNHLLTFSGFIEYQKINLNMLLKSYQYLE